MTKAWIMESTLLIFDGTVLEFFGTSDGSRRFHVDNLMVKIGEPDRKGRRMVQIGSAAGHGLVSVLVKAEHWTGVEPLLTAAMNAAKVAP